LRTSSVAFFAACSAAITALSDEIVEKERENIRQYKSEIK
jgi:hypothetical protein